MFLVYSFIAPLLSILPELKNIFEIIINFQGVFTTSYLCKKRRGIVQLLRIFYNLTSYNFGVTGFLLAGQNSTVIELCKIFY